MRVQAWWVKWVVALLVASRLGGIDAFFDSTVLPTVYENLVCDMTGPVQHLEMLGFMYESGSLVWNASNTTEELRQIVWAQIQSVDNIATWLGAGYKDGASVWYYTRNASWLGEVPRSYENTTTSPHVYEVGEYDVNCEGYTGCLRTYYSADQFGTSIDPYIGAWDYNPRTRPWYLDAAANGSKWLGQPYSWLDALVISAQRVLVDVDGNFIGVASAAISLSKWEDALVDTMAGSTSVVFVMDSRDKKLLAASQRNVAVNRNTVSQNYAFNCNSTMIEIGYEALDLHGYPVQKVIIHERFFVKMVEITQFGSLPVDTTWYVVHVQPIFCISGTYLNNQSLACEECDWPNDSTNGPNLKCTNCVEGYYWDDSDSACHKCKTGTRCETNNVTLNTLYLKHGYWRVNENSVHILDCLSETRCEGGSDVTAYCEDHSEGPYCDVCSTGYYSVDKTSSCLSCSNVKNLELPVRSWIFLVGMSLIICVSTAYVTFSRKAAKLFVKVFKRVGKLKAKWKVTVLFMQITTKFPANINVGYPTLYVQIMTSISSFLSLDIYAIFPMLCFTDKRINLHMQTLQVYTLGPILFSVVLKLIYELRKRQIPEDHYHARLDLFNSYMFVWLFTTFICFTPCSDAIFRTFSHENFDDGTCFLTSDYSTRCHEDRFIYQLILASLFIVVYPIGIPALYFVLLYANHAAIDPVVPELGERARMEKHGDEFVHVAIAMRSKPEVGIQWLSFLFDSYEPAMWWWELFECARRLCLTSGFLLLGRSAVTQSIVGFLICLLCLKLYTMFAPYVFDDDDTLAEVSQWATLAVLFSTLLISTEVISASSTVGIALVIVQFVVVAAGLVLVVQGLRTEYKILKAAEMEMREELAEMKDKFVNFRDDKSSKGKSVTIKAESKDGKGGGSAERQEVSPPKFKTKNKRKSVHHQPIPNVQLPPEFRSIQDQHHRRGKKPLPEYAHVDEEQPGVELEMSSTDRSASTEDQKLMDDDPAQLSRQQSYHIPDHYIEKGKPHLPSLCPELHMHMPHMHVPHVPHVPHVHLPHMHLPHLTHHHNQHASPHQPLQQQQHQQNPHGSNGFSPVPGAVPRYSPSPTHRPAYPASPPPLSPPTPHMATSPPNPAFSPHAAPANRRTPVSTRQITLGPLPPAHHDDPFDERTAHL